jgi:aspartate/methionine/tyrosine aminotransferase
VVEGTCVSSHTHLVSVQAIARVMDFFLHPAAPLDWQHVFTCDGASSMLEMLAWALTDPGDVIMVPAPYYPGLHVCFLDT